MAWKIKNWTKDYEVNDKNRAYKEGDTLRAGRLDFIRLKNHGRKQGVGWRRMLRLCKGDASVWGVFCKFLEIAGDSGGSRRGVLLNEHDEPATIEHLHEITGFKSKQIEKAIQVLTDPTLMWIEPIAVPGVPGDSGKTPFISSHIITDHSISKHIKTEEKKDPLLNFGGDKNDPGVVMLTQDQWGKLGENLGRAAANDYIERANGYFCQIGPAMTKKKYKSHYHTILNWWRRDQKEGKVSVKPQAQPGKYAGVAQKGKMT